MKLVLTLNLWA